MTSVVPGHRTRMVADVPSIPRTCVPSFDDQYPEPLWISRVGPRRASSPYSSQIEAPIPSEPPIVEAPNGDLSTSFGFSEPELTLSFESPDTRGSLELEAGTDSIATVVVPAAEVGLFILRDRLEVDNTTHADGAYRLVVPRSVLRIRVQIPGRPLRIITTPDVGAGPLQVSLESDHEGARRQ